MQPFGEDMLPHKFFFNKNYCLNGSSLILIQKSGQVALQQFEIMSVNTEPKKCKIFSSASKNFLRVASSGVGGVKDRPAGVGRWGLGRWVGGTGGVEVQLDADESSLQFSAPALSEPDCCHSEADNLINKRSVKCFRLVLRATCHFPE